MFAHDRGRQYLPGDLKLRQPQNWPKVTVPVMGVWGEGDLALAEEQMIASEKYVSASWRYKRIRRPVSPLVDA
jgi:hypothetical protein